MNPGELERNLRRLADLASRCGELGEEIGVALEGVRDALSAAPPADERRQDAQPQADMEIAVK